MDNPTIAQRLREYANQIEARERNLYRVRAYRKAAETVLTLARPLTEVVEKEGRAGLEALPGIGPHLSFTLEGLVREGKFRTLGSSREELNHKGHKEHKEEKQQATGEEGNCSAA